MNLGHAIGYIVVALVVYYVARKYNPLSMIPVLGS